MKTQLTTIATRISASKPGHWTVRIAACRTGLRTWMKMQLNSGEEAIFRLGRVFLDFRRLFLEFRSNVEKKS